MTIIKRIVSTFFCLLTFSTLLFGQLTPEQESERKRDRTKLESLEKQRASRSKIKRFYGKLTKEQKKRITPSDENVTKHRQILNLSKTDIVKILPNPKCDLGLVNANDLKCVEALPIVGMGSWYSFSKKSHSTSFRADISFTDNNFSVGFTPLLLGLIVDLGDLDINSINLNTNEIQFLTSFLPTRQFSEISKQREQFAKGFESHGKIFSTKTSVRLNTTYAMRSVNYYKVRYYRWDNYYDDITLIFRIVDIDSEGAITLIWRKLKKDSTVKIFE